MFSEKTRRVVRNYLKAEEGWNDLSTEQIDMNIQLCIDQVERIKTEEDVYEFLKEYDNEQRGNK